MLSPGIIGGADGPTGILVASAPHLFLIFLPIAGIFSAALIIIRRRRKK